MRTIFARLSTAAAALAIATSLSAPAQAMLPSGVPLQGGGDCGIQVYLSNSNGVVIPKANASLSGHYRFSLYQAIPTSDLNVQLEGRFSGNGRDDTELGRSTFMLGYVAPGGYRGMDELRDAELGQDAMLRGSLQVYDTAGRMVCATNQVSILPFGLLLDRPATPPRTARYVSPYAPTAASQRVRARAADPTPASPPSRTLTQAQCERLRSARPAQCRYD
jgi:hypothetical protein